MYHHIIVPNLTAPLVFGPWYVDAIKSRGIVSDTNTSFLESEPLDQPT